ncbi:hypothetical protein M413DRAFT_447392 [Hebeloma cylindrosporum]|uniref:Uncharacterized protein n=1 Tax=Hebeloma cylindrosporum TaxID=76867 RepID=A0A0C3C416_HEBCY|nr:hypothetical protein M413DRAFT_447392 [Hebeloma cylindrosporum h7]
MFRLRTWVWKRRWSYGYGYEHDTTTQPTRPIIFVFFPKRAWRSFSPVSRIRIGAYYTNDTSAHTRTHTRSHAEPEGAAETKRAVGAIRED